MNTEVKQTNLKEQTSILSRLLTLLTAVNKLLIQENSALEKVETANMNALTERKAELYSQLLVQQQQFDSFVKTYKLDKTDKNIEKVQNALADLNALGKKNQALIMVNLELSEHVIEHYKELKTNTEIAKSGYNKEGRMNAAVNKNKAVSTASLNNKI